MESNPYNSFLLVYPKSSISKVEIQEILNIWDVKYELIELSIESYEFYNEIYDLDVKLSLNKARQCGLGKATLFLYETPLNIFRLRPTFTEIKLCNIFAFDLKHILRAIDGKNLIHGSTDESEYKKDIKYILSYQKNKNSLSRNINLFTFFLNFLSLLKKIMLRVKGRLIYTIQKTQGYFSYYKYCVMCFFKSEYKLTPCFPEKWRWSSSYFLLKDKEHYFIKLPNKHENIEIEKQASDLLEPTGFAEKCELVEYFGFKAIKKKWLDIVPLDFNDYYKDHIVSELENLFDELLSANIHHSDIKYDNLQYESETGRIILIDFGLSKVFEKKSSFKSNIKKFDQRRWNDCWNLFDDLVQKDPSRLIKDKDVYYKYATMAGKYAANDENLRLIDTPE